jgi:hypothetical protein
MCIEHKGDKNIFDGQFLSKKYYEPMHAMSSTDTPLNNLEQLREMKTYTGKIYILYLGSEVPGLESGLEPCGPGRKSGSEVPGWNPGPKSGSKFQVQNLR